MSNNVFEETTKISNNKVESIVSEFRKEIIRPYFKNYIHIDKIKGLGSTRKYLTPLNYSIHITGYSGDIDLLVLLKSGYSIKYAIQNILKSLKNNQIKSKTFFGNIISVCFYSDYKDKPTQVDIMFATNKLEYDYLYRLKFYSNETSPIKGLHRTELIRSLVKFKGLSLGMNGFKRFKWNDEITDINTLKDKLKNKFNRARTNKSKLEWMLIRDWLTIKNFKTISELKEYLCKDTNYLQNRLYIDDILNIKTGINIIRKLRKVLFIKEDLSNIDWKMIMKKYLNLRVNNIKLLSRVDNLNRVLKMVKGLKYIRYIIYDYKKALESKTKNYYQLVKDEVEKIYEMDA